MADKIAHDVLYSLFSTVSLYCSFGRRWERWSRGPSEASVFEEVMPGVRLVDADAFHLFHAWAPRLRGLGLIPAVDRVLEYSHAIRHMLLGLAAAPGSMDSAGSGIEATTVAARR
jgi:hypothetical protein